MKLNFFLTWLMLGLFLSRSWAQIYIPEYNLSADKEFIFQEPNHNSAILNYGDCDEVLKFQKLEIGVDLPDAIQQQIDNFIYPCEDRFYNPAINPYLEWEIRVKVTFTHLPSNEKYVVDGFYFKDFQSYMLQEFPLPEDGESYSDKEYQNLGGWYEIPTNYTFRVRFAPPKTGDWSYFVEVITINSKEDDFYPEAYFTVLESDSKGFVKVSGNKRYLEQYGNSFFPVGTNVSWPESKVEFDPEFHRYHEYKVDGITYYKPESYRTNVVVPRVYEEYKKILTKLSENGVNYLRTIMNPVSTEIEWEKLGDYTARLTQASELDKILELAESKDIYLHWSLSTHFTFKYNVYGIKNWDWIDSDGSPSYAYKKVFKLEHPTDFFRNEEAKRYYKQRLRYIISRWGYSTNIAAFEVISEISNIGSENDDNDAYYHEHYPIYELWQTEMGEYVKSMYNGQNHLLTASYSGTKNRNDLSYFKDSLFDIMTSNIYDFGAPDFSSFFTKMIAKELLNESEKNAKSNVYTMHCDTDGTDCQWNIKPMMMAESEPIDALVNCHRNPVEMNRHIWQSAFSGMMASLSWSNWYFVKNYHIYQQLSEFMSTVSLNKGNWHPGASMQIEKNGLQLWEYNPAYAAAMNSGSTFSDIAYLRSGDLNEVVGVLTNKTYNIYNADTCLVIPENLAYLKTRSALNVSKDRLRIMGLSKGNYRIDYFLPENQKEPIYSSYQKGIQLKIDLPMLSATREGYIVLFRATKLP